MAKPRVAAIGIDAAEWAAVESLVEEGALPNIEKHLDASSMLEMHGDAPYRAEASWTEFLTGRKAADNRYWSTAQFDPGTYEMWEVGAYRGVPFYGRPDIKSIVFDTPHAHLAPEARGVQITGWGAHSPQFPTASSPRALVAEVDRRFGVHRAIKSDSLVGWHNDTYGRNLTEAMLDGLDKKADISAWLLDEYPDWDLFVTVLSETHVAGHQFLHGVLEKHPLHGSRFSPAADAHFRATYSKVDEVIGRLTASLGDDTTVVLFAVHGMAWNGADTACVWLPELLHRMSFGKPFIDFPAWTPGMPLVDLEPEMAPVEYLLRYTTEPVGSMYKSKPSALKNRIAWGMRRMTPPGPLTTIEGMWRRASGVKSRHVWWEMDVREPGSPTTDLAMASARQPCDYHVASWFCAHWPKMRYFVLPSFSDTHIRINLKGREQNGLVDPREYGKVLDEVEEMLRGLTNARTGTPVVAETYRVRADDPMNPDGPTADLVITFADVADVVHSPDVGVVGPCPFLRSGEHTNNGWAAFRTPSGASGALGEGRPLDLAPTLLDLLGRPQSPLNTGRSVAPLLQSR
ncbi:MAG TPA: alkaline phosphatase family protein [Acidimicrobiales bacterium]|nr:alkaline phosphatase family protein [Acidimicrobiales bacterium]